MTRLLAILLLVVLPHGPAAADPAATLYDRETLSYWGERYARSSERILLEGIAPELEPAEYRTLLQVRLRFPLRGEDLIGFYAVWPPPEIVMPAVSLKLLDDLSIAMAWLWVEGYSLETVEEYVAMLRYKPQAAFPGGRYPLPFAALGVPQDVLSDQRVDDLSLRFFNSARAFILAHELAHLHFRHEGRGAGVLQREIQADRFALDVLARTGTVPMGIILYFQAMAHWAPNRAQFDSEQAWQAFLRERKTHPLSGERVAAIAEALAELAPAFARNDPNPRNAEDVVRSIAGELDKLVDYLDDGDMQRCVGEMAANAPLDALAPRPAGRSLLAC